jgi:hypothetical protein
MRFYLRWLPHRFLRRLDAAASSRGEDDGTDDLPRGRRAKSSWSFIMPFDLEHYIEDHSTSGEHLRRD